MASKIILKKSSVIAKAPVAGDLEFGELAINYSDSKLYFKKADGSIDSFSATTDIGILPDQTGNAGQYLTTDGTTASWAVVSGGGSPLTTKGDIFVAGVGGVASRLPVGVNGAVLTADSTQPLGLRWALAVPEVVLIATNITPAPSQATLQAYYDGVAGFPAPNTVPAEVTAADVGTTGYSVYLGYSTWWYRFNSSGDWIVFLLPGKGAFGQPVAKLFTYK